MSLFNVFNTAGSALNAETIRLNTTASNLANAESVNGDPSQDLSRAASGVPNHDGHVGRQFRRRRMPAWACACSAWWRAPRRR